MTNEMVQFSDLNCFKELPTYMLQAKDMRILRSFVFTSLITFFVKHLNYLHMTNHAVC
jgi:hypothetical protein